MFIDFYYRLKQEGVPVSLTEWMTLMDALARGFAFSSLSAFYFLARAILVKSETNFDRYDLAFSRYFKGIETPENILEEALAWLKNAKSHPEAPPTPAALLAQWNVGELRKLLEERLEEQKRETVKEKRGGPYWIGTGGTSPFGNSGSGGGVRIGGESESMSAVKVAAERRYLELRDDSITGVRQFELALRALRQLSTKNEAPRDELDLDGTVDATSRKAGMLNIVWQRPRRNRMKVILLMDTSGSMLKFAQICRRLFTAVNRTTHFKDLKFYYFYNCVYDSVYANADHTQPVKTEHLFKTLNPEYRLIITGDATMNSAELFRPGGTISWSQDNELPGIVWLQRLAKMYPHAVWLNPVTSANWTHYETIPPIREIFPMFELTPAGLEKAIQKLKTR